jgi:hypothetical protein
VGTGVVRAPVNLKRCLPEDADMEYVAGFVDGWLAADGDPVKAGSWRLRSIDHEALAWVEQAAPAAGYVVVGSGQEASVETNFGVRSRPIRWLYLATRETSQLRKLSKLGRVPVAKIPLMDEGVSDLEGLRQIASYL